MPLTGQVILELHIDKSVLLCHPEDQYTKLDIVKEFSFPFALNHVSATDRNFLQIAKKEIILVPSSYKSVWTFHSKKPEVLASLETKIIINMNMP